MRVWFIEDDDEYNSMRRTKLYLNKEKMVRDFLKEHFTPTAEETYTVEYFKDNGYGEEGYHIKSNEVSYRQWSYVIKSEEVIV